MKTLSRCLKAIRRHLVTTVVALLVILILTISISGYLFQWDFAGVTASSDQKITINTPNGTITVIQQQPAKTLWDWMSVLVIPVGLIILGAGFQQAQDDKNDKERIKQADIDADEHARQADIDMEERERQAEEVRQAKVQTYVDKIVDFLLHGNLLTALPGSPVRLEAQARTLTLLEQLEGDEDQKKKRNRKEKGCSKEARGYSIFILPKTH